MLRERDNPNFCPVKNVTTGPSLDHARSPPRERETERGIRRLLVSVLQHDETASVLQHDETAAYSCVAMESK